MGRWSYSLQGCEQTWSSARPNRPILPGRFHAEKKRTIPLLARSGRKPSPLSLVPSCDTAALPPAILSGDLCRLSILILFFPNSIPHRFLVFAPYITCETVGGAQFRDPIRSVSVSSPLPTDAFCLLRLSLQVPEDPFACPRCVYACDRSIQTVWSLLAIK